MAAWPAADVSTHTLTLRPTDALLTLTFARDGTGNLRYGVSQAVSESQAQAALARFAKLSRLPRGSGGTVDAAASKAAGQNS